MPSILKRRTSHVQEGTFSIYTGDDPRPGNYRALLKRVGAVKSGGDNVMLTPILELKGAAGSEKSKFDGYAVFPNIVLTDNESNMQREQAFYMAVCGKKDADVVCDVDPGKFKPKDGQKASVLKIGGVKPEGIIVNVKLRMSKGDDEYPSRLECDLVFASRDQNDAASSTDEEDDEEIEEDGEEIALYEEDELLKLGLPALRKILVEEFDLDKAEAAAIKKKAELVAAILEAQEEEEEEEDDEEDEEEDEDEADESDEDEEEEDEEEDDEEDPTEGMTRAELKEAISKRAPGSKFLKSQTDDDLREIARPLIAADPPF